MKYVYFFVNLGGISLREQPPFIFSGAVKMEGVVATEKHSEVCHPCLEFTVDPHHV